MQTKQHAMKKPNSYSNIKKYLRGTTFWEEESFAENVQNLEFLLIQKVGGTLFNISCF